MKADMLSTKSGITMSGPLLLKPKIFPDSRGSFYESWNSKAFNEILSQNQQPPATFVQDNHSISTMGVLRGLHFQINPHGQAKLVRCVVGEIFDVAVDIRTDSPTYGQWVGARLSSSNSNQLWVPTGFAHGFLVLSDNAEVLYKTTDYWCRQCERSVRWDDPSILIDWPELSNGHSIKVSDKDRNAPSLQELLCEF